jgi:HlyD family secretion protein
MESALSNRTSLSTVRGWRKVPPLRLDLRFVRSKDARCFRLCDPRNGKFVELFELECLIAQAMDGERSPDELLALARSYNPAIKRDQIEQLLVALYDLGLLDPPVEVTKPGLGKVIALPVPQSSAVGDEFASFRNEVVLDLQRDEALKWSDTTMPERRTPFFEARAEQRAPTQHDDGDADDDELGDATGLATGAGPFKALEKSRDQMIAAGETESDTMLSGEASVVAQGAETIQPQPAVASEEVEAPASPTNTPASVASETEDVWNRSKASKTRWYKRAFVRPILVVALLIGASTFIHYPLRITSDCSIVPTDRAYVRSPIKGVLAEILVDEGTPIHKGDVLARLDDRDLQADRRKATAEVERLEADLDRLHHGARPEEISQLRSVLGARQTAVVYARKEALRREQMATEGVGSKQQAEEASSDLQVKQNAAAEAAAALRLLEAGTRPEEVAAHKAALKRAQAELEYLDQKLSDMVVIRAPIDGVVLTPKFRERIRESVEAGGLVCEIANTSTMHAEIYVSEREADTVAVGMPVVVKVESYPLHPFSGKVDFIAPAVELRDKLNVVRVVATIDNKDGMLRQDMTGYGEVEAGKRSLFDLATRRLLRWVRVRFLI